MDVTWLSLSIKVGTGASASTCPSAMCTVAEPKAPGQMPSPISNAHHPPSLARVTLMEHAQFRQK